MSQWDIRVKDNIIWIELQHAGTAIDSALKRDEIDVESIAGLERIRLVLTLVGKRLASTDPLLLTPSALSNLSTSIIRVRSEIESFAANGSPGHIVNANSHADDSIVNLGQVPGPLTAEDVSVISAAALNFRETLEGYLEVAKKTQKKLTEITQQNTDKVISLEALISNELTRLSTVVSEQQSQFSAAQDARASTYSIAITEQRSLFSADQDLRKSTFSEFPLENQKVLSSILSNYSEKIKSHEIDMASRLEKAEETHIESLEELREEYEKSASDILVEINQHKKAVESLVGVIGNLGVTSGYQKVANYARTMLLVWQTLTVLALVGLIWVAYMVAFPPSQTKGSSSTISAAVQLEHAKEVSSENNKSKSELASSASVQVKPEVANEFAFFQGFATRIFLSITFGIFATYAARQAGRFFEMEQQNRRRALELEALGPFIEPLDKSDRDKFRIQIGERSFAIPENSVEPKVDDTISALSLFKPSEWADGITNIIKASKS